MQSNSQENRLEMNLLNRLEELERLTPLISHFAQVNGLRTKDSFALNLALDEILTNTISYGYEDDDDHNIQVCVVKNNARLTITIKDCARPFDPLILETPEIDIPLEERERQIGGMGVHLVRNMMDEVSYQRSGDINILNMVKNLDK